MMISFLVSRSRQGTVAGSIGVALVLLGSWGCKSAPAVVSGTVEARRTIVSAETSGTLTALQVDEGDHVEAGALLAEIDCRMPRAQAAQAQAQLDVAQAQLAVVRAGARSQELSMAQADLEAAEEQLRIARRGATREQLEQLRAGLDAVRARLELARLNLERAQSLRQAGSTTGAAADEAAAQVAVLEADEARLTAQIDEAQGGARREERRQLEARVSQASDRLALLEAGARTEELSAAEANVDVARAALALSQVAVDRCRVEAPTAGIVDIVDYDLGELVTAGAPLIALAADGPLKVQTYAPQNLLGDANVGTVLPVIVDGAEQTPLRGRITWLADQAEFTMRNVQTPEDRMLLVFSMELELEPSDAVVVRPGMSVTVDLRGLGGRP